MAGPECIQKSKVLEGVIDQNDDEISLPDIKKLEEAITEITHPEKRKEALDDLKCVKDQATTEAKEGLDRLMYQLGEHKLEVSEYEKGISSKKGQIAFSLFTKIVGKRLEKSITGSIEKGIKDKTSNITFDNTIFSNILDNGINILDNGINILSSSMSSELVKSSSRDGIQIVMWDLFKKNMSGDSLVGRGINKFNSVLEKANSEFVQNTNDTEGSPIDMINGMTDSFKAIKQEAGIIDGKENKKGKGNLENKSEFELQIEKVMKPYSDNLEKLIKLGADTGKGTELNNLLQNPTVLSDILENGKYIDNNYNVDLSTNKFEIKIISEAELNKIQSDFMKSSVEGTNNSLDTLEQTTKLISNLDSFIPEGVKDFLFKIPIIGEFLKMLFNSGGPLGDIGKRYDEMIGGFEGKSTLNLRDFSEKKQWKDKFSFDLGEGDFYSKDLDKFYDLIKEMGLKKESEKDDFWKNLLLEPAPAQTGNLTKIQKLGKRVREKLGKNTDGFKNKKDFLKVLNQDFSPLLF